MGPKHPAAYGAPITHGQYRRAVAAGGIGSVLEWYDYTILVALSPIIGKVFFPPGQSQALQQLSFWSVYFVGYICRPLGSLLFGHICDVHGRRLSLMVTLLMMAAPTVLIGCLPTYAQGGVAAPVLLSLLRLVQGIAVGGELGTAVVFLHELSPAGAKSRGGAVVFLGVTGGILSGLIMAMVINAAIPHGALVDWGWRIPFLIAIVTAGVGMMLRYNLPESFEFEGCEVKAAHRRRVQELTAQQAAPPGDTVGTGGAAGGSTGGKAHKGLQLPGDAACVLDAQERVPLATADQAKQEQQHGQHGQQAHQPAARNAQSCAAVCCGHGPIGMLFRDHWREVLLLFWFEYWSAANFYVFYGFLPAYITSNWKVPPNLPLGMTLTNMTISLAAIQALAHLSDRGLPRLAATAAILGLAAVASVPMLLAVSSRSMVAAWLMQLSDLLLNAAIFGMLGTIGSVLFPVHVRATGYNFAHTAAQSWLGGLTPVILSALQVKFNSSVYLITGVYLTCTALISLAALGIMWRLHPQTNRCPQHEGATHVLPLAERPPQPMGPAANSAGGGSGGGGGPEPQAEAPQ